MKISFNLDPNKQAQEIKFGRKKRKFILSPLNSNHENLRSYISDAHHSVMLFGKLSFEIHLEAVLNKVDKTIGLICNLQSLLLRPASSSCIRLSVNLDSTLLTLSLTELFICCC